MLVKQLHTLETASTFMPISKLKDPRKFLLTMETNLKNRLNELEQQNIFRPIVSTPADKSTEANTFWNQTTVLPKEDTIKVVFDARHFNSNTDQSLNLGLLKLQPLK